MASVCDVTPNHQSFESITMRVAIGIVQTEDEQRENAT
jgi:hypothetical protein